MKRFRDAKNANPRVKAQRHTISEKIVLITLISVLPITSAWVPSKNVIRLGGEHRDCEIRLFGTFSSLHAKRRKNDASDDGMSQWYDPVDDDASPDDVFLQEMERQRLMNGSGEAINGGGTASASYRSKASSASNSEGTIRGGGTVGGMNSIGSFPSENLSFDAGNFPPNSLDVEILGLVPDATEEDVKAAEATLAEYQLYAVKDNWLDEELIQKIMDDGNWKMEFQDGGEYDEDGGAIGATFDEETELLMKQLEELEPRKNNRRVAFKRFDEDEDDDDDDDSDKNSGLTVEDEPWDTFGEEPVVDNRDNEFDFEDHTPDKGSERRLLERFASIQTRSRRLKKASVSPKAKEFFAREPDASQGFDTMWVAAVDNVCFKSLVGNFCHYGIEFADNFGDWQDGCPEDGLVSIEDMASFKARSVFNVTGLPCISIRTSFEVEPVYQPDAASGNTNGRTPSGKGANSPRVLSGYWINDIGMNVDYLCDALGPLSRPDRVTRFKTCMCFYDGEIEVFEHGTVDVDMFYCHSIRTLISVSVAMVDMVKKLKLAFSLEYQKFLRLPMSDGSYSSDDDDSARAALRDRVLKDGKVLPNGIIDVSSFMDSQVDVNLMDECAKELSDKFAELRPTKILTVATTGLVVALPMAKYLQVPVVYARKERNVVMSDTFQAGYSSKTVGKNRQLLVSKSHLNANERILIVDDFLSSGASQEALFRIVSESEATVMGVAVLLEKTFESGRQSLSGYDVPVHSLCKITSVDGGTIQLEEERGYKRTSPE